MPHDPDVKALLRVAAVWNVAVACNRSSADFLLSSPLMDTEHSYRIPDYESYLAERLKSRLKTAFWCLTKAQHWRFLL